MLKRIEEINPYYLIFIVFLFYMFFPNNYSYWDAYSYAGHIKYEIGLFSPHHLFYNPVIFSVKKILELFSINPDVLLLGKYLNSIFQLFNLIILLKILKLLKVSSSTINWLILLVGFSFNLWRFGTENEAYIMPITFSLLGSFYLIKYLKNQKIIFVLFSSLFAAIACLFHQIHFFWWLGLMFGFFAVHKSFKTLFLYTLPAWVVPLGYALVVVFYNNTALSLDNLLQFVLRDFYRDSVIAEFGLKTVFLSIVSCVRTFVQVHPIILTLLQKNFLFFIPLIISFIIGIKLIYTSFKERILVKQTNRNKIYGFTHLFILIGHLSAAVYNVGNVEFMVMVPFLVILILVAFYTFSQEFLKYTVLFMFIWNFSFGILPYNLYPFYEDDKFVDYIIQNPHETYVVKSRIIKAKYFYKTGKENVDNIKLFEDLKPEELETLIKEKTYVITDAIDYPEIFNKEKMLKAKDSQNEFDQFSRTKIFEFGGLFGNTPIHKVSN